MLRFATAGAALASALVIGAAMPGIATADDINVDLVTHNSIVIQAPAAAIWPKILEPGEWKAGAKLIAIEGKPDEVPAKFKAVMPETPDEVAFYSTNVEVIPLRRRTVRLNATDGVQIGFASWELSGLDNATVVEYHVYSQIVMPEAALASLSEAERTAFLADYTPSNYKRFQSELETLKQLVEKADTR